MAMAAIMRPALLTIKSETTVMEIITGVRREGRSMMSSNAAEKGAMTRYTELAVPIGQPPDPRRGAGSHGLPDIHQQPAARPRDAHVCHQVGADIRDHGKAADERA